MQLIARDGHAAGVQIEGRHFEGSLGQAAIDDREAAVLPNQKLQMRSGPADEDERVTIGDPFPKLAGDNATERIKPFTHVGLFAVKMISPLCGDGQQTAHDRNDFKNSALTG